MAVLQKTFKIMGIDCSILYKKSETVIGTFQMEGYANDVKVSMADTIPANTLFAAAIEMECILMKYLAEQYAKLNGAKNWAVKLGYEPLSTKDEIPKPLRLSDKLRKGGKKHIKSDDTE